MEHFINPKKTRLILLYERILAVATTLGADNGCLDTLKKGILDRQILKKIQFSLINEKSLVVATFTLLLDWEKLDLTTIINSKDDINSHFSEISELLEYMRQHSAYSRVAVSYSYIDSIALDDKKSNEASSYLGFASIRISPDEVEEDVYKLHEYCYKSRELETQLGHILMALHNFDSGSDIKELSTQLSDLRELTIAKLALVDDLTKNLETTLKQYKDATVQLCESLFSVNPGGEK